MKPAAFALIPALFLLLSSCGAKKTESPAAPEAKSSLISLPAPQPLSNPPAAVPMGTVVGGRPHDIAKGTTVQVEFPEIFDSQSDASAIFIAVKVAADVAGTDGSVVLPAHTPAVLEPTIVSNSRGGVGGVTLALFSVEVGGRQVRLAQGVDRVAAVTIPLKGGHAIHLETGTTLDFTLTAPVHLE